MKHFVTKKSSNADAKTIENSNADAKRKTTPTRSQLKKSNADAKTTENFNADAKTTARCHRYAQATKKCIILFGQCSVSKMFHDTTKLEFLVHENWPKRPISYEKIVLKCKYVFIVFC